MRGRGPRAAAGAEWQRAAAYVVCCLDDRILLTHLNLPDLPDHGAWTLPGGGLEWGEQPLDAAHRELEEETGLTATIGGILGVWSTWLDASETVRGAPGHALGVLFDAVEVAGELRTEFDEGSTDAAAWFPLDEVPRLRRVPIVDAALAMLVARHQRRDPSVDA
ncbi:MAG TPA: NUDIX domain-containing protein [Candidatus Nanopelagicales bacterium]|nr:NUDIX domain-containing protein [Candidatus Nanopelagicales bacterium]